MWCLHINEKVSYAEIAVDDQFNLPEVCCIDIFGTYLHYQFVPDIVQ